jgi:hypothetical protein
MVLPAAEKTSRSRHTCRQNEPTFQGTGGLGLRQRWGKEHPARGDRRPGQDVHGTGLACGRRDYGLAESVAFLITNSLTNKDP